MAEIKVPIIHATYVHSTGMDKRLFIDLEWACKLLNKSDADKLREAAKKDLAGE